MNKEERKEYDKLRYLRRKKKKKKKGGTDDILDETLQSDFSNPDGSMSAMKPCGTKTMDIDEYCEHWGLDSKDVKSYRLMTHRTPVSYNIVFHSNEVEAEPFDFESLNDFIDKLKPAPVLTKIGSKIGVVNIADLHGGAYIDGLRKTGDYSIKILIDRLNEAAERVNDLHYYEVHVHILGDLIESFSGLNHANSWGCRKECMVLTLLN